MQRVDKKNSKPFRTTVLFTDQQWKKLERESAKQKKSKSQLIRELIESL